MDNVLMTLLLAHWFVFYPKQGCVRANVINMAKDVNITMITLNCTVNTLISGIDFRYPNENYGHAYCIVPGISGDTQCNCSCNSTLTCKCKITQNISTKTTTLHIMDTIMTGMFGWYTCAHGSYKKSTLVTRPSLCLEQEVNDTTIKLSCTPDELKSGIYFYFPDISLGHAYCNAPRPELSKGQCNCSCNATSACECSIIQDIATKITTLLIRDNNLTSLVGLYTCVHGSIFKSTMVATHNTSTQDCGGYQTYIEVATIVVPTVSVTAVIVISILSCVFPEIPDRMRECMLRCISGEPDKTDCEQKEENEEFKCATCNEILTCALCVDCRCYYCDVCCVHHREMNGDHIMFPTKQIAVNQQKVDCDSEKCKKTAERLCIIYWKPFCTLCANKFQGENKRIIKIYQAHSVRKRRKSGDIQDKLFPLYNLSFRDDQNPVRVCGMAFLVDETVVVIDGNNNKLIIFKSKEEQSLANNELSNEPNAITAITGNKFAVTYPYQKYIQLYELTYDTIQSNYRISSLDPIETSDKPFSIAYNQGIFAVEIGEREDGRIVIIDVGNGKPMKTIECHFAFFTGHTIRLALDQNQIFVSAMGKKMVYCMDFDGKTLWHQSVPGPRAIIVSEDYSSSKKIILASKRCNAIYELKKDGNHHEILKATDKINSPRYMAYHSFTNTLCVLVENEITHEDELGFFKFKNADSEESTSPSEEIPLQSLSH